jgi:putative PIN family toxin of toxin-antitoxin system
MKVDRFVVDSNVLISAALRSTSTPSKLLYALRRASSVLIFSKETKDELQSRLMKSKFDPYVSASIRLRYLAKLDAVSEYVYIANRPMGCRGFKDDKFLETAVYGNAQCLITGDNDLLCMHPFQKIPILKPCQGLKKFFPEVK